MSHKKPLTHTLVWRKYHAMKGRCLNPRNNRYAYYGGRGIKVCDRWLEGVERFVEDMGFPPTDKHELDRIDVNGNYEPSNCRWATRAQQVRNTRKTVLNDALVADLRQFVASGGKTKDWALQKGIHVQTCYNVTKRGAWAPIA